MLQLDDRRIAFLLRASWISHIIAVIAAIVWLSVTVSGHTPEPGYPPIPPWVVVLWIVVFLMMLAVPFWPAMSLILYTLLATVVARYEPGVDLPLNVSVLAWVTFVAVTGTAVWAIRQRAPLTLLTRNHPVTWAMLALVTWIAITAMAAYLRLGKWDPNPFHHPRQYFQIVILFLLASRFLAGRIPALLMSLVICIALSIRGRFLSPFGVWLQGDIASLLAISLPLSLVAFWCTDSRKWRGVLAFILGIVIAHNVWLLIATQNRAAAVAVVVEVLVLWLMMASHRWRWLSLLVMVPIGYGISVAGWSSQYIQRFVDIFTGGQYAESAFSRIRIWQAGWKMAMDHPIMGVGPGHFYRYVRVYDPGLRKDFPSHNVLINLFAETGAIGLLLYTAVFVGAVTAMWRISTVMKNDWPGPASRMICAGICGYLTIGMFLTRHDLVLAYILVGWAIALRRENLGWADPPLPPLPEPQETANDGQ